MIVDDHEIVREGLKTLSKQTANIEVVAEAGIVAEAVAGVAARHPMSC